MMEKDKQMAEHTFGSPENLPGEYAELLKDNQDPKNYFKKKKYKDYFEAYCQKQETVFSHIKAYWNLLEKEQEEGKASSEQQHLLNQLAYAIADAARQEIEPLKGLKKGNRQGELNLFMVTSVFPCTLKLWPACGEALCQEIVQEWKKAFPGNELGYTDFEKLNSGFRSFWGFFTGR